MRIAVFGASGFLGSKILHQFSETCECIPVFRRDLELSDDMLAMKLQDIDGIVNFMGAPVVGKHWTERNRIEIMNSRILPAQKILKVLPLLERKPEFYLTASAVGLYKNDTYSTETSSGRESGFITEVIENWENQALLFSDFGIRVIIVRLGTVLDKEGGALNKLVKIFRWGIGGKIGKGNQYFPWISSNDAIRAVYYLIHHSGCHGIYNLVEHVSITNLDFTRALAKALKRPAFFTIPVFILLLIFGKGATLLTDSKIIIPENILKEGFTFQDDDIYAFLRKELSSNS